MNTFKFRDDIAAMVGAPDALLAAVRQQMEVEPISTAGDRSRISDELARKWVIDLILEVTKARLLQPLAQRLQRHMVEVSEEYRVLEGDAPPDAAEHDAWVSGYMDVLGRSLEGEYDSAIGAEAKHVIDRNATGFTLAQMLTQMTTFANENFALQRLGITHETLKYLMDEARGPKKFGLGDLADIARHALQAGVDILEVSNAVENALITGQFMTPQWQPADDIAWALTEFVAQRPAPTDNLEAEWVMQRATASVFENNTIDNNPHVGIKLETVVADSDIYLVGPEATCMVAEDVTPARAALLALQRYAAIADADLAQRLGITRPKLNNYRSGKTSWEPSQEQIDEMKSVLAEHMAGLTEVFKIL